ncbi:helix-turn-helix domain-containing protein [Vreelandella jeotgali]|uniref:helix-turn-helix domain-containing protein n=1 Tax=Vreelandella jeotgali TaxID=553386 RepID=UPI00034518DF|nr:helix-turn-helix transcriptional regulator [Halomonas jeotgali]
MIQNEKYNRESVEPLTHTERSGLVIRSLRNFFGMSQGALAEASGVSRPTISRLEKLQANRSIRTSTLDDVMQVFFDRGVELHVLHNDVKIVLPEASMLDAADAIKYHPK